MAKLFKVSAYVVDSNDEFNEESLNDCLYYCTQNDIDLKYLTVDSAYVGEWDDNHKLNYVCCPIDEFEKYFKR